MYPFYQILGTKGYNNKDTQILSSPLQSVGFDLMTKTISKNWANRQKAKGIKLELQAYPARGCWKKRHNHKIYYFKHPITKDGYEAALLEWLKHKAELNFEKPYMALIKHYLDLFKPVQNHFDQTREQTTKEQKIATQIDQFVNWLEEAFVDPETFIPEVDSSTSSFSKKEIEYFGIVKSDDSPQELSFTRACMKVLSNKPEFSDSFACRFFGKDHFGTLTFELSEHWKEKTEFAQTSGIKIPQSLGYWADDYLKAKASQALAGQIEISTYTDAIERLGKFRNFFGDKTPITKIDSEAVKKYYYFLLNSEYANKRLYFQYFKTFILYIVNEEACNLEHIPNALASKILVFRQVSKAKSDMAKKKHEKLWTKKDIQRVIAKDSKVPQRFQCWILLMLNCGMTQSDLNDLKRDEIDLVKGRIVRIRKKAEKYQNPPVVNYKLWDVTLKLLKKEMALCTDEVFALQAMNNARIVTETIQVDATGIVKTTKADNASRNWGRNRATYGFKDLQLKFVKKAGVTALAENIQYIPLKPIYLGQTHRTIADKHYDSKGGRAYKPLDQAIAYIGKQFGLK
ncbi:MAG TPA: hypothetical protein DDZ90_08420 [Planctomycetaceae bacterium]|nr:hypothetical protein [Planctomycetaceae bacterium]